MMEDFESAGEHDVSKPFLDHLEDLRGTLIKCIATLFIAVCVAIPFADNLLAILLAPLEKSGFRSEELLMTTQVTAAFTSALKIAMWGGVIISFPLLTFFIGQFVFPGLKAIEKKIIYRSSGFIVALFAVGVCLGYFVTLPVALKVMMWWNKWMHVKAQWILPSYLAFCTQLILAFGLVFQMPVVIFVLGKMGIVNSKQLREKRRHTVVILLVVAMLLTPPDVFTQLIMAIPLYFLYEVSILLLRGVERRRMEEEQAKDVDEPGSES